MEAMNMTREQLDAALKAVNKKYKENITWNRAPESVNTKDTRFRFNLKVKDSKEPGHRRGTSPNKNGIVRRMINACWHVHGHFFEECFKIVSEASIRTGGNITITKDAGNWQDRNIGSMVNPMYFSEACDC